MSKAKKWRITAVVETEPEYESEMIRKQIDRDANRGDGIYINTKAMSVKPLEKEPRKIDAFALAKKLGPKISLNFNEWKLIARAVEAQLKERK